MVKRLETIIKLRLFDKEAMEKDTPIVECKVVFQGTYKQCNQYAQQNGWTWKRDSNLFGGYWRKDNGDCLMPT